MNFTRCHSTALSGKLSNAITYGAALSSQSRNDGCIANGYISSACSTHFDTLSCAIASHDCTFDEVILRFDQELTAYKSSYRQWNQMLIQAGRTFRMDRWDTQSSFSQQEIRSLASLHSHHSQEHWEFFCKAEWTSCADEIRMHEWVG